MTTDSHLNDHSHLQLNIDLPNGEAEHTNESTGAIDMVKRDRFELLSAYLDGEVTAAERRQVEELLANDQAVKCLYARLLKLRQGLRTMPVPQSQPVEETVERVISRLHRRRVRLALICGGTAIAATLIGAVSGLLPGGKLTPQLAKKPATEQAQLAKPENIAAAPLIVSINNPILPIPKAAETTPEEPVNLDKQLQPLSIENEYH
ncbi:transcriptional regulator [Fischerella thermalis CCMEE 5268]|uniref:Transcriptional regulator n=1 Tax=Fischerella thermalis CCMEE 5268 TaxID=2019662 RepID=A0A2N6K9T8_9CYAN|nr:zf-HC2 domain-containing protein [Fischerella thermalis]PLZ94937.1 transcriptional regulator [Fischerella thermalis CCMEE 5268]